MQKYSVIIPALNEANYIGKTLDRLQAARGRGHEIIVVDGGSLDQTCALVQNRVDNMLRSTPGRARQMNIGAQAATGAVLIFLHADTLVDDDFDGALDAIDVEANGWGRFKVRLSGGRFIYRCIETLMNMRSQLTAIATGDQAIFVNRTLFFQVGGFADMPLMEDIDLSRKLRKIAPPRCMDETVVTSSRRWEENGVARTIFTMWKLRCLYALGYEAKKLARQYD